MDPSKSRVKLPNSQYFLRRISICTSRASDLPEGLDLRILNGEWYEIRSFAYHVRIFILSGRRLGPGL